MVDFKQMGRKLDKLGEFMDGLFDGDGVPVLFGGDPTHTGVRVTKSKSSDGLTPLVTVEIEVPGCKPDGVDVSLEDGRLSVSWTPRMTGEKQSRTFSLSKSADLDAIVAKVADGYLVVTIPCADVKPASRKVRVG